MNSQIPVFADVVTAAPDDFAMTLHDQDYNLGLIELYWAQISGTSDL